MEVRRIEHGEVISQPGIYDMPIRWYHDNCCDGPSISSSGLRTIDLQTPLHYWDTSYLNPDRDLEAKDELEGDHFRLGRAVHWRMLEPELFGQNIAVRPDMWDSWRTKDSQTWMRDTQKAGYTVMIPSEMERVDRIVAALRRHPLHEQGILGGAVETSLVVRDPKTGIWLKSRPDSIPRENSIADLKIMAEASPQAVERAVSNLGYDMQTALTGVCWFLLLEQMLEHYWLVCIENARPHAIHVAAMSQQRTYWARLRIRRALNTMAKCLAENDWPAYNADGQEVGVSDNYEKLLKEHQKAGLMPREDDFSPVS